MPSVSETKNKRPLQMVTETSKPEGVIITINGTTRKETVVNAKEEAGKPLYLKRV